MNVARASFIIASPWLAINEILAHLDVYVF
jgi:hypothetical protein